MWILYQNAIAFKWEIIKNENLMIDLKIRSFFQNLHVELLTTLHNM
jgi:hypothetical protein